MLQQSMYGAQPVAYGAQPMVQRPSIGAAYGTPVGFGGYQAPTLAAPTLGAPALAAPAMTLPQTGYFNNYNSGIYGQDSQTHGLSAAHGVGVGSVDTTAKDKPTGKTRDLKKGKKKGCC